MPRNRSDLLELHGVGEYTARSVLIHTEGEAIAAVDTNVERLLSRFFDADPEESDIGELADGIVPPERSSDFLHAMLDLAAAVYTSCFPGCDDCPVQDGCDSADAWQGDESDE